MIKLGVCTDNLFIQFVRVFTKLSVLGNKMTDKKEKKFVSYNTGLI